jgi:hypothetical protein
LGENESEIFFDSGLDTISENPKSLARCLRRRIIVRVRDEL